MARNSAWVFAAFLLLSIPGRAAGLGGTSICEPAGDSNCEKTQATQQRGAQPPASQPDKAAGQRPERVKWWIDPKRRAELAITDQQSALVEQVWQKSSPSLGELRERLTK